MSDQDRKNKEKAWEEKIKKQWKDERWWDERTLPQKILLGIGFAVLGLGLLAFGGWVIMLLWNWLMPEIFGLPVIGYWQTIGLFILSKIFFSCGGSSSKSGKWEDRKRKNYLKHSLQNPETEPLNTEE